LRTSSTRITKALDQILNLVLDVVDAEGGIHARDLEGGECALAPAGDLANQVEILLTQRLHELVDDGREQSARAIVHVLYGIDAQAVEIRERDPELEGTAERDERLGGVVIIDGAGALVDILQRFEIAFAEFRVVVPVADLAFARERVDGLQL
jgi:hypothetical protein